MAVKGRYPYFVTLDHFCGGALVAPDIVLAAGHCKTSTRRKNRQLEQRRQRQRRRTANSKNTNNSNHLYAHIGTFSFHNDVKGVDYEEIRIVQQVRHPSFKWVGDDEFIHDFLLLKLQHAVSSSHHKNVTPIQLNRYAHIPANNQSVVAMGVGNTDPDDMDSQSDVLRVATLNAITNSDCELSIDPDRDNLTYSGRIFPSMMCTTGGVHNERDAWCV